MNTDIDIITRLIVGGFALYGVVHFALFVRDVLDDWFPPREKMEDDVDLSDDDYDNPF